MSAHSLSPRQAGNGADVRRRPTCCVRADDT
jgi:hypothetical protein